MSDSPELLKPDAEVTDSELQTELSNLKAENERLHADYAALLESSTVVTKKLRQEVQEVRSQLEAEKSRGEEIWEELEDSEEARENLRLENSELKKTCGELRLELADREKKLAVVLAELLDLKQKSATARKDLPEAADLLNQLKTKRKK